MLEGVLRRARLSGLVNDLAPFRLDSWDRRTARAFVKELGPDQNFDLDDSTVTRILDLLGDPVPYHVQLFFSALRDACRGDSKTISPQTIQECFTERLAGPSGTAHLDHYATRLELAFNGAELETALGILGRVCRREDGGGLAELNDLLGRNEATFRLVLRDLESDGYLRHDHDRLQFRSNLLRQWWTMHRRAMTRQRLYNPAQLTPEELKASFVARKDTLAEMLRLIREQPPGHPCQHMMLIGPRGMGKTTLGLRLLHEILETPELAEDWQPVAFPEESYEIGDLADFWLAALRHLTRATGDPQWAERAEALPKDEKDTDRQAAYALASLMDFCQTSGKRLLLFVENLDTVLEQLGDERQIHALRASLIERTDILLIGSANTVFDAIRSHGEPLYEFFRLFILKGLGPEETRQILAALADGEGKPEVMEALERDYGRVETIRRLTGGNPRLLVLACRILIDSPLSSAFEDLERLIDTQTPYFKARIEELPVQARKVFHCLAEGWKPIQSKEVAEAAKLSSSHASAQLRQLMEKGYAREVTLPSAKRTLYEVSDRFYNIYYLLRFSRAARDRLERLVAFLHDLFGATTMQTMYATTLSNVLARRGNWTEALDALERALHIGGDDSRNQDRPAVTASLIRATASGHGLRVKQIMEDFGLVESMEPLWHAVRAELGEELEPLPAEIMDAVTDIRREFHNNPDTLSRVT